MKKTIAQTPQGGNGQLSELPPYRELMLRALLSALKDLPGEWSDGWLALDRTGRNYLKAEAYLFGQDLRFAINDGVGAGFVIRMISGGCPCIALAKTKVVRR